MSCATFKAAILRRPLNASPAMPKIYGSRGQTAVFRPRRINPCVNLCIKLTENASDASVFSVSLKRSFLTQVYPQIYFHSVPADKSRIPGIGKYCNTATAVSAVGFELDTNTNFEVKRISHKRRKCSGFILTATKVRFCITDTVHLYWNTQWSRMHPIVIHRTNAQHRSNWNLLHFDFMLKPIYRSINPSDTSLELLTTQQKSQSVTPFNLRSNLSSARGEPYQIASVKQLRVHPVSSGISKLYIFLM